MSRKALLIVIPIALLCVLSAQNASATLLLPTSDDGHIDIPTAELWGSSFTWTGTLTDPGPLDPDYPPEYPLDGAAWTLDFLLDEPWALEGPWFQGGSVNLHVTDAVTGADFTGTGSFLVYVDNYSYDQYSQGLEVLLPLYSILADGEIDGGGKLDAETCVNGGDWFLPAAGILPSGSPYYFTSAPTGPWAFDVLDPYYPPKWMFDLETSTVNGTPTVPEPCSAVLLALAAGGGLLAARRRRRSRS